MATRPKTRVVYIAGRGRSGSTVLDSILGQIPGFFACGELIYLWRHGLVERRLCGCGTRLVDCEVWRGVLEDAFGDVELIDGREMDRVCRGATRTRHLPLLLAEAVSGRRSTSPRLAACRERLARLYGAIGRSSGGDVVVDSSKSPAYAAALAGVPGIELSVVHLVRDPRAVAYSWRRRKALTDTEAARFMEQESPVFSSVMWDAWNVAVEILARSIPERYVRLRYEDFVARPRESVARILALVGEQTAELPFESDDSVRLAATHAVSGNPSRFERGSVPLRLDDEWRSGMSVGDRTTVTGLTWPLLLRYGYPAAIGRRGPEPPASR